MATIVSELFDKVLLLEEDETIVLTFKTQLELNSKKVLLFREKAAYEKKMSGMVVTKGIVIRQRCNAAKQKFQLLISTSGTSMDWLNEAVVVKGKEERKLIEHEPDERMQNLMKKDMK